MRPIVLLLSTLAFTFAIAAVAAESGTHNRYKWKDGQGNLHYDDALPVEAVQFGYDVVNPNGIVVKHVDRPKTAAETKTDDEVTARKAGEKHAVEQQAKSDQQMLAAYPVESELAAAQQAQLDMIEQNIRTAQISLDSQEKSLTDTLSHAANLDRNGKPVPAAQQQQIDSLRRTIQKLKAYVADRQQEKAGLVPKFADELAHYRELRAKAQVQH